MDYLLILSSEDSLLLSSSEENEYDEVVKSESDKLLYLLFFSFTLTCSFSNSKSVFVNSPVSLL